MKELKTQKGITLIALVITIIVMLILVGVSVSISLNGGLFTTAKTAATETAIAKELEMIRPIMTLSKHADYEATESDLEGFTKTTYKKYPNDIFYVSETGIEVYIDGKGQLILVGDINEDGKVDEQDGELLTQICAGKITEYKKQIADLNHNGIIDTNDKKVVMLIYYNK